MLQLVVSHEPVYTPTPAQLTSAKQAQFADRQKAIADTARDQAKHGVKLKREARDVLTVAKLADVILEADADEAHAIQRDSFADLPPQAKHALMLDMAVAVRQRQPVYRRLSVHRHQQAVVAVLKELASHKLSPGEIGMLAAAITGLAHTAALGVLDSTLHVTPTEFAAATLDLCGELR